MRTTSCRPTRPGTGACTRQASGRRRQAGYTVLELLIVAAIGLLVLSFGVGSISRAMAREELDGWARTIGVELTAAQQAAMTRRTSVTVSFQNNQFTVVASGVGTLLAQGLPSHLTFGAPLQTVTFDRRGVPGGASSVSLTSTRAAKTYTITIQPNTGRVTVDD